MSRDPRVDAYIAGKAEFARPILDHIRALIHSRVPTVEESIKWSMPFFSVGGRPLANMAAFKAHASFGFWNRQELPTGKEGEAMGQLGRLTDLESMPPDAEILAMIDAAVAMIDARVKPKRAMRAPKPEAEMPIALTEALAKDQQASANWNAFPPGCRREYCEWIVEAKRDETRAGRVARTVAQTRDGKKLHWKYENC